MLGWSRLPEQPGLSVPFQKCTCCSQTNIPSRLALPSLSKHGHCPEAVLSPERRDCQDKRGKCSLLFQVAGWSLWSVLTDCQHHTRSRDSGVESDRPCPIRELCLCGYPSTKPTPSPWLRGSSAESSFCPKPRSVWGCWCPPPTSMVLALFFVRSPSSSDVLPHIP